MTIIISRERLIDMMWCVESTEKKGESHSTICYTESQKKYSASDIILVVRKSPQMSDVSHNFSYGRGQRPRAGKNRYCLLSVITDDDHAATEGRKKQVLPTECNNCRRSCTFLLKNDRGQRPRAGKNRYYLLLYGGLDIL